MKLKKKKKKKIRKNGKKRLSSFINNKIDKEIVIYLLN